MWCSCAGSRCACGVLVLRVSFCSKVITSLILFGHRKKVLTRGSERNTMKGELHLE